MLASAADGTSPIFASAIRQPERTSERPSRSSTRIRPGMTRSASWTRLGCKLVAGTVWFPVPRKNSSLPVFVRTFQMPRLRSMKAF